METQNTYFTATSESYIENNCRWEIEHYFPKWFRSWHCW